MIDWEHTSLQPYIKMLDEHVSAIMEETRRIKRDATESMCLPIFRKLSDAGLEYR